MNDRNQKHRNLWYSITWSQSFKESILGNTAQPKPSPLVQQIISQTLANRPSAASPTSGNPTARKESGTEEETAASFNNLSMAEKLAALVGLTPPAGNVEGEITQPTVTDLADIKPAMQGDINSNLVSKKGIKSHFYISISECLRRTAQGSSAANGHQYGSRATAPRSHSHRFEWNW